MGPEYRYFEEAISRIKVCPNIDLFASRLNCKLKPYTSYQLDPEAFAIHEFSFSWNAYKPYAFLPFCVMLKALQKIAQDRATSLNVVPYSLTQPWWHYLVTMLYLSSNLSAWE